MTAQPPDPARKGGVFSSPKAARGKLLTRAEAEYFDSVTGPDKRFLEDLFYIDLQDLSAEEFLKEHVRAIVRRYVGRVMKETGVCPGCGRAKP